MIKFFFDKLFQFCGTCHWFYFLSNHLPMSPLDHQKESPWYFFLCFGFDLCFFVFYLHHKFSMQQINNEKSCEVHSFIGLYILHTNIIENTFDTRIHVLMDKIQTYK
jgi:hypothetical protein